MAFFQFFRRYAGIFRRSRARSGIPSHIAAGSAAQSLAPQVVAYDAAPPPAATAPEELRRLLFDAVAAGDERALEALCREHHAQILHHAADWLDVPIEIGARPELKTWYLNGLLAIRRFCAQKLGRADFLNRLDALPDPAADGDAHSLAHPSRVTPRP